MNRCWAILGIGLVVLIFRKWIATWHHVDYLHRTHRDAAYQRAYLRLWDHRAEQFVSLVIGLGIILIGLVCLAD